MILVGLTDDLTGGMILAKSESGCGRVGELEALRQKRLEFARHHFRVSVFMGLVHAALCLTFTVLACKVDVVGFKLPSFLLSVFLTLVGLFFYLMTLLLFKRSLLWMKSIRKIASEKVE